MISSTEHKRSRESFHGKLGRSPLVVASIGGRCNPLTSARKAVRFKADLIEIRFDTLALRSAADARTLAIQIRQAVSLPVIATVRSPREGGRPCWMNRSDEERKKLYETLLPFVDLLDIELSSAKSFHGLLRKARALGRTVILSYHDFRSIPSEKKVKKLLNSFREFKGDIFKVAGTPKGLEDVAGMMTLCRSLNRIHRVFIAMGEAGRISRVAGFSFGSCLTYGSVDQEMAPGQIPIQDLVRFFHLFYSPFCFL